MSRAVLLLLLAGCALRHEDAKPADMAIEIRFPSVAAALAVESIELQVYDASNLPDACAALQGLLPNTPPPPPLAHQSLDICQYYRGEMTLPAQLGERALVAIAYLPGGDEAFFGCAQQFVGDGDAAALSITMSRSGSTTEPVTARGCRSMEARCNGQCVR